MEEVGRAESGSVASIGDAVSETPVLRRWASSGVAVMPVMKLMKRSP